MRKSDLALLRRAAENGWGVDERAFKQVPDEVFRLLKKGKTERTRLMAAKTILAIQESNVNTLVKLSQLPDEPDDNTEDHDAIRAAYEQLSDDAAAALEEQERARMAAGYAGELCGGGEPGEVEAGAAPDSDRPGGHADDQGGAE